LRGAGLRTRERRDEQRGRDRTTLRYFAAKAQEEFGIDERRARAGVGILLGAVETVLAQFQAHPTADNARLLNDTYIELVMGGLRQLAANSHDGKQVVPEVPRRRAPR